MIEYDFMISPSDKIVKTFFSVLFISMTINTADVLAIDFNMGTDYHFSEINIVGTKINPKMMSFRIGTIVSEQIGVEVVYRNQAGKDELFDATIQLEDSFSAYLRLLSKTYEDITMEIDLGYASTNLMVQGQIGNYTGSEKFSGFSYRIAAEEKIRGYPDASIRIAYESLFDDGDLHIRGYSLGISYQF